MIELTEPPPEFSRPDRGFVIRITCVLAIMAVLGWLLLGAVMHVREEAERLKSL